MSGAKRKSKYRKHIESAVLDEFPEPQESEEVVVVVASRGGNILEVKPTSPSTTTAAQEPPALCLLPSKYRKLVWVKRGSYLIVSKAADDYETASGKSGKVKYTVNHILFPKQVKHLVQKGMLQLPTQQQPQPARGEDIKDVAEDDKEVNSDDDSDLFVNRNRRGGHVSSSSSSSSSEEEDEDEEAAEEADKKGATTQQDTAIESTG